MCRKGIIIIMNIQLIAVGKLKEKYWLQAIAEYDKRLSAYAKVKIIEVADEKAPDSMSEAEEQIAKHKEGERILAQLKPDTHLIVLDIAGKMFSSEELAAEIDHLATYGTSQIAFVIGGSNGLSDDVICRAHLRLSFGKVTYPHQLMRVIVLEQIYRAFKIIRGEPYHR